MLHFYTNKLSTWNMIGWIIVFAIIGYNGLTILCLLIFKCVEMRRKCRAKKKERSIRKRPVSMRYVTSHNQSSSACPTLFKAKSKELSKFYLKATRLHIRESIKENVMGVE